MFQLSVKLNEPAANPKQEPRIKDISGQDLQIQQAGQLDLPRNPDIRQEPPVPVEPAAPSASVPEKKEPKDMIQQVRVYKLQYCKA
jgi:hypothetical protein